MNINGWDISGAQAKQWNVTPGFSDIENESEWQRGSHCRFSLMDQSGGRQYGSPSWYTALIEMRSCRIAAPCFPI